MSLPLPIAILVDAQMVVGGLFHLPAQELRKAAAYLQERRPQDESTARVIGMVILMLERMSAAAALLETKHVE